MSYGFNIAENLHVYPVIPATSAAADFTGDYVDLGKAAHCDFVISWGACAGSATVQVYEAESHSGSRADLTANWIYYLETTEHGDTPAAAAAGARGRVAASEHEDPEPLQAIEAFLTGG